MKHGYSKNSAVHVPGTYRVQVRVPGTEKSSPVRLVQTGTAWVRLRYSMGTPLVRFGYVGAEIKFSGEFSGTGAILRKIKKKRKERIYTFCPNLITFALTHHLSNTAARGDTAAKRRRRPIHSLRRPPATATQGVPRLASICFCPLLHLFVFPSVRKWSEFLGAPAYQQTTSKQLALALALFLLTNRSNQMANPVILEDVEKVRQLAKVIWYKEVDAIKSINFPSEQERSKYLRDCRDNHSTVEELLDQGVELKQKNQNDAVRYPIAEDIFLYIVYCGNSALQTVRNCTVRKDYLSKISTHVESLIKELGNLDTGNLSDVSTLKEEAAKYKESMLEFINKYRSSASAEFSRWVNQQGLTFDKLVQKYQHIRGLGGLFKDLKEEDKILVYDDIMQASGRGSVIKSWLSKAMSIGGAAVVVITAGLMVWDIYSSDHKIQTTTHDAVVSTAAMGGAILGDIIGAAIATDLVGVEATSMFVAMAGFATGLLGAFILAGIAGGLIELIVGSGGAIDINTDNHKCYVAAMPDGVVLARQIAHNQTN